MNNFILLEIKEFIDNREINIYKASLITSSCILAFLFALFLHFVSKITKNLSWVDRFWNFLPTIYFYHFHIHNFYNQRKSPPLLILMSLLSTLWSGRLFYNYYRKGGYSKGSEDYRWEYVKKTLKNKFLFEIFHFCFISVFQNYLLFLLASPGIIINEEDISINASTLILTILFIFAFIFEAIADQQQWNFQIKKYALINNGKELFGKYKTGFIKDGLFKYSRHPNFFAEVSMWWIMYLFTVNLNNFINWTISGAIILTLLFQGSTALTESITKNKYKEYSEYQKTTSRLIPMPNNNLSLKFK